MGRKASFDKSKNRKRKRRELKRQQDPIKPVDDNNFQSKRWVIIILLIFSIVINFLKHIVVFVIGKNIRQ